MRRLTYRSLLLSTVISMGQIPYGSDIQSSNNNDLSEHFESIGTDRTQQSTIHRARGQSAATAQASRSAERPQEHYCPITLNIMENPVVASDGYTYERDEIARWIAAGGTSPMTRQPLSCDLHPNQSLKILIKEWNPHQTYRTSALADLSAEDIVTLLREEFHKNKRLLDPEYTAENKDIVVFLGNTGAGKSTLINFLAEKELSVEGTRYALSDVNDQSAMPIGTRVFKSETLYPKSIDIHNLRFFDLPGFNDTDGSIRNLVNAAFIRRILLEAKSVRFVFVAGQDQFTADRGASVNTMTKMLQKLFVVEDSSVDLINQGLFVVTKEDQLIDDVIAANQEGMPQQIRSWSANNRIDRMYHSVQHVQNNAEHRQHLLARIESLRSIRLSTLNVSALYPPETAKDLERMYTKMFKEAYEQKKATPILTVSEYESHLKDWKHENFWNEFESRYFNEVHPSAITLRGFAAVEYQKAREAFVHVHALDKDAHVQALETSKTSHIENIKQATEARAATEIKKTREEQKIEGVIPFDFANHVMYQERVCGKEVLERLTPDEEEHEIIRGAFAQWISQHYQQQLEASSLQKQIDVLTLQNQALNERIETLREDMTIPEVARGHEEAYRQFLKGKLIYKPDPNSDAGRREFPISDLANPLTGTFNISGCGDSAQHLSISTGFRRVVNPGNSNKVEVWIVPRFVIDNDPLAQAYASDLAAIGELSGKPFDVFFNWGDWDNMSWFWVVPVSSDNLFDHFERSLCIAQRAVTRDARGGVGARITGLYCESSHTGRALGKFLYNNE